MIGRRLSSKFNVLAALSLSGIAFAASCSKETNSEFTASSGSGATQSAGSNAGGNSSSGGDVGGGFLAGSGGNGAGGNGAGGGCASTSSKAEQIPLDIFIMLDQSGSMSDPVAGGFTKWKVVTQALANFVIQPNLSGVSVGLGYFGVPPGGGMCPPSCNTNADCVNCGGICQFPPGGQCSGVGFGDSCNAMDYAKPEVEIAPLPGVSGSIVTSLSKHMPSTGTPTSAALDGAIIHAIDWEKAHPTHLTVVVLATDGDPGECDVNLANINAIAAKGANGMPKILTFVIGVGPSLQALDGIAAAGGTMTAFHVDTNGNAQQQFLDAMNKIRGSVLACSYIIPKPAMGMLDYGKVNVEYVPGGGGMPVTIPKVANKAACPPNGMGWYYNSDIAPTQIILCDDTCTQISMDAKAQVNVVLGCTTVIK